MIPKQHLKWLIRQRFLDAEVLFIHGRFSSSVYFSGYALELALKLRICTFFNFNAGFPECKEDFLHYQKFNKNRLGVFHSIIDIRDIKNHDLNRLLFFSGEEIQIKNAHIKEWNIVKDWQPQMRYSEKRFKRNEAMIFLKAIKSLIQNL